MNSVAFALADTEALLRRDQLLRLAEERLAEATNPETWRQIPSGTWTMFENTAVRIPRQGWKLHISATPLSAAAVVRAVLPILFRTGCSFKMVSTLNLLTYLNAAHSSRAASGKFITIYPKDDAEALALAHECDDATASLLGPVILSDRSLRPGSLVHYRYGGFLADRIYMPDGSLKVVIRDPEGRPLTDDREAWFAPPPWVDDPFPKPQAEDEKPDRTIVLGERFEVIGAMGHSNKGGVYKAIDRETGLTVVLKEARPQVGMDKEGRDVADRLSIEHKNLQLLSELGLTPSPIAFFQHQSHSFLAMEIVEGTSLTRFVARYRGDHAATLPQAMVKDLIVKSARLLEAAHAAGFILRDFTPNNLMLLPSQEMLLIDPELACSEDETHPIALGAGTPGYVSPEQWGKAQPSKLDDCFSMGGLAYHLATSRDPLLATETGPEARSARQRLLEPLDLMVRDGLIPPPIQELVEGCLHEDRSKRFNAEQIRRFAEAMTIGTKGRTDNGAPRRHQPGAMLDIVRDIEEQAVESLDFERRERPLTGSCLGEQTDPTNVQYGIAGVGSFLIRMLPESRDASTLRETISEAASWTLRSHESETERPLGLYFGKAGAAWFALDAARSCGDDELLEKACRLALSIPTSLPLLDVTHGAAGVAMALLKFGELTHRDEFTKRAEALGDLLLSTAKRMHGGLFWPTRQATGKDGDPLVFYGFAHGTAGITYSLLALAGATGRQDFLNAAIAGGETLIAAAEIDGDGALWSHGPGQKTRWPHWCNGSSGVGTTLIRLYHVLGDSRYLELAEKAGNTVVAKRWWHSSTSQCHGPAGNAELLLDLHAFTGDQRYLEQADRMTEVIVAQRVHRDGRTLFADDTQLAISPDYSIGTTGVGFFLHRLVRGGPRAFMTDSILEQARPCTVSEGAISKGSVSEGQARA